MGLSVSQEDYARTADGLVVTCLECEVLIWLGRNSRGVLGRHNGAEGFSCGVLGRDPGCSSAVPMG